MEKKIIYTTQEQQEKDEFFDRKVMFMKAIAWQLDKWLTDIKVKTDGSTIRCIECGLDIAMANDNSKVFNNLLGYLSNLHWRY